MITFTDLDDRYNTRLKTYPDGNIKLMFCNKHIFRYPPEKTKDESKPLLVEKKTYKVKDSSYVARDDSVKRAKDKLFDLVYCNEWDLFVTVTFNPEEVDSFNVKEVIKKMKVWLSNKVERKELKYLLVPELHKSGRIHCHLLCNDIFELVDSGKRSNGRKVYNLPEWKYGFSTAIYTHGDRAKLSCYITKYITKGNDSVFGRFYWSSRNIVREPDITLLETKFEQIDLPTYRCKKSSLLFKYDNMTYTQT